MQYQRPVLIQEQRLKMSPQMYQSIQMMALPLFDLRTRIQEEIEKNPALEIIKDSSPASLEEVKPQKTEDWDYFENSSDPGYIRSYNSDSADMKRQFLEGALSRSESLQEHLLAQLAVQPLDDLHYSIGELLIQNLDENGFHLEDPHTLVEEEYQTYIPELMELIQSFDPTGVCVSDYKESLLLQAKARGNAPEKTEEIIKDFLPRLKKEKPAEIAKQLGTTVKEVEETIAFIKTLNPYPGRLYSNEPPRYVIPDLSVKVENGDFIIVLNEEEIPVLGISPFFRKSDTPKMTDNSRETKKYIRESVRDAQWFINSIHLRNQTLLKITKVIIEFQRNFFLKGPKYLAPLTLKDVADEVGVHETTVSRISNAKYMQTEWGIFPLKYFFSNSISGAGSKGSRFSKGGVKEIIKEIIEENTSDKKLSDQKISNILKSRGINIARRTVAKYRSELLINSSFDR